MPATATLEAPTARPAPRLNHRPLSMGKLGQRIRDLRHARKLSQTDVARLMDLSKQTVSGWESGAAPPQLRNLVRFAAILGTDAGSLLDGLSDDLETSEDTQRRLLAASHVVPLYSLEDAGKIMRTPDLRAEPDRYIATVTRHPPGALAALITGVAMAPRFAEGDTVTFESAAMAEPGALVLAYVGGRFLFRRFLPHVEGRCERAVLRALNRDYPDIEMHRGDAVLGRMVEHTSLRHTD
jgi:transcriptional regulator with XRE-family HTH domain